MTVLDDRVPLLVSPLLTRAGFAHGFTTRSGGVSAPPFESLDFALLRNADALRENQARLARTLALDPEHLYQATQVHGATVVVANGDRASMLSLEADALVAEPASGHVVAIRVADCVPVLVADPSSGRVAAIHAGWRGIEAGVVLRAVRAVAETAPRGAGATSEFLAAIGPCIGPCCFEVGLDVGERIARTTTPHVVVRTTPASEGGKAFVDLRRAVRTQLEALGLSRDAIDEVPAENGCTRCDAARFYSYRRDGDASGRLLGIIAARATR